VNRLLVATRSRGKQAEFRELLAPFVPCVVFPDDIGLAESPHEATLEAFDTFLENARAKATWFSARAGLPVLADDSGLEVLALGGEPGVRSKRFAGQAGPDHDVTSANNRELLRCLAGLAPEHRGARYRCVLVLRWPDRPKELVAEGSCLGRILDAPRGTGGFGYDPLFWSEELGKTFGEATIEEKARVSHRGRAVAALADALAHGGVR
jgi:XTP/dITP diphosphohydrolase